jgi:AsmA protein
MALSTSFGGTLDSISLDQLTLLLDDTTATGSLRLSNAEAVSAGFELALDSVNLDRYLAPQSQGEGSGTGSTEGTLIPVELLRDLDAQGQVQIEELQLSGLQLTDLRLSMNASDGRVELSPVSTALYRGTLDASANLSVAGTQPVASLDVNLSQVDLEPLMFDFMDASYISGRGNVSLALSGSGADSTAIQRSLSGNGSLQLQDGVLRGVDVASVLRQLETMIRSRRPGNLERGDQTAFESFSGTLTINDGVIATNDLLILSPGFQVTGGGYCER